VASIANAQGTVRWSTEAIPMNSMDLDEALTKVRAIGLVGPIMTATLNYAHPRGGQALLVWIIVPKVFRNGGQRAFCLDAKRVCSTSAISCGNSCHQTPTQ